MNKKIEMTTQADRVKFEVVPAGEGRSLPSLVGYPIVWGAVSNDSRSVRVVKGAVTFPTDGSPVHALYAHDYKDVIGSTANGTLRLYPDDPHGLRVEIDPPDTQAGRDVVTLVSGGYVAGMSFGVYVLESRNVVEGGRTITEYTKILVDETTVTAIPAMAETSISVVFPTIISQSLDVAELDFAELDL